MSATQTRDPFATPETPDRFGVLKFTRYPDNGSGLLALVRVRIGDLVIDGFQIQGYVEEGYVRHTLIPPSNCYVTSAVRERLQEHIVAEFQRGGGQ